MLKEKEIKLKSKEIQKMGEYHYVSVPKSFIDNNLLSINKKYDVVFIEKEA